MKRLFVTLVLLFAMLGITATFIASAQDDADFPAPDQDVSDLAGPMADESVAVPLDQVIADDLIVRSLCAGFDCIDGENFGFDTVRLKENNLRIHFEDTSASVGFPANDWRIVINDSPNGGSNYFAVQDATASGGSENGFFPFRIDAGAPDGSLRVAGSGNVGIGTTTPATALDVNGTIQANGLIVNGTIQADGYDVGDDLEITTLVVTDSAQAGSVATGSLAVAGAAEADSLAVTGQVQAGSVNAGGLVKGAALEANALSVFGPILGDTLDITGSVEGDSIAANSLSVAGAIQAASLAVTGLIQADAVEANSVDAQIIQTDSLEAASTIVLDNGVAAWTFSIDPNGNLIISANGNSVLSMDVDGNMFLEGKLKDKTPLP